MLSFQRHLSRISRRCLAHHPYRRLSTDLHELQEQEPESAENYGFAPDTIDIISHSQLDFINKKQRKQIDRMEEEISIHLNSGFQVYEHDRVPIWNPATLFQVGHRDQFRQFAASNIFKLFDTFMHPVTLKSQWTLPGALKSELGLRNTTSIIDYHPFSRTFPEQTRKAVTKRKLRNWKVIPNEKFGHFEDSCGRDMPLLTRDGQQLLVWRDVHSAIRNVRKMHRVLKEYNPDIIVLEGCCDESTMKIYGKAAYNWYLKSVRAVFSRCVPTRFDEGVGAFMHRLSDVLFVRQGEIQSEAFVNHAVIQHLR